MPIKSPDPDMVRAAARRAQPGIGTHVASLNLFREADGTFWLTVASAPAAVEVAKQRNDGTTPMQVLAVWVREAAANFINSWGHCDSSMKASQKRLPRPKPKKPT